MIISAGVSVVYGCCLQLSNERARLQEQLQVESVEKLEMEDIKERLVQRVEELEDHLKNANRQLEEDEDKLEKSSDARRKLQVSQWWAFCF